jgi:hypothetical protein
MFAPHVAAQPSLVSMDSVLHPPKMTRLETYLKSVVLRGAEPRSQVEGMHMSLGRETGHPNMLHCAGRHCPDSIATLQQMWMHTWRLEIPVPGDGCAPSQFAANKGNV